MQTIGRGEDIWGNIGSSLGELAAAKVGHLLGEKKKAKEKADFFDQWKDYIGDEKARWLSNFEPEQRKQVMNNPEFMQLKKINQEPEEGNILEYLQRQTGNQGQPGQGQMYEQQDPRQQLQSALGQYFNNPTLGQGIGGMFSGEQSQQQEPIQQFGGQEQMMPRNVSKKQGEITPDQAQIVSQLFQTPQERAARKKAELENKKLELAERRTTLQATKKYIDELKAKEKAVTNANFRLKKMEESIEKGNLPNAQLWSALTKAEHAPYVGGLASVFVDPIKSVIKWYHGAADIEEFEKLSNEFVKDAKQYFGSKITEKEVQMFMQTVPNLMQTDAGKKKIIDNIRSLNDLVEVEAKAARSIIKENGGIPPIDIEQQVHDKIENRVDKVVKKFTVRA